jgi:hypothetical protein
MRDNEYGEFLITWWLCEMEVRALLLIGPARPPLRFVCASLFDVVSEISDNPGNVLAEGSKHKDNCQGDQGCCHCVLGKFQTGFISKKVLDHFYLPLRFALFSPYLLDVVSEVSDNAADVLAQSSKHKNNCQRDQSGCHCVLGKFQTGFVSKKVLNHFDAPLDWLGVVRFVLCRAASSPPSGRTTGSSVARIKSGQTVWFTFSIDFDAIASHWGALTLETNVAFSQTCNDTCQPQHHYEQVTL